MNDFYLTTKNRDNMKEFWNIMAKDILSENFTKKEYIVYGIVVPVVLIVIMELAGAMDQASGL